MWWEPGFNAIGNEETPEQVILLSWTLQFVAPTINTPCLSTPLFTIFKWDTVLPEASLKRTTVQSLILLVEVPTTFNCLFKINFLPLKDPSKFIVSPELTEEDLRLPSLSK